MEMSDIHHTVSEVDFSSMKIQYIHNEDGITILGAKRSGIEYQNFWTNVRTWFDEQIGTSIKISRVLIGTELGDEIFRKLSRTDEYARFARVPPSIKTISLE